MDKRGVLSLVSLGVIAGFLAGLIMPLVQTIKNNYIPYQMYRTVAAIFQKSMISWIIGITVFLLISALIAKLFRVKKFIIPKGRYIRAAAGVLVLFLVLSSSAVRFGSKTEDKTKSNIIILLIDTLRKDHMSLYGYYRSTTPNMDNFSREACVFKQAISQCSWTSPAVASLFTGLYSSTHGCISYATKGKEKRADVLDAKLVTLAELMKENGYATGAFVASPWICQRLGFDAGFDVFDPISPRFKPRAGEVNEKALDWIGKNKGRQFFAYLHYMDVHGPYRPPEPYNQIFKSDRIRPMTAQETERLHYLSDGRNKDKNDLNYYIDRYDAEIRFVDHHIGNFFEQLKQYGLLEKSVIIITADHGEAFFDHGFCDHGWSLYGEEINIPLIIKFPGRGVLPDIGEREVELVDIFSSIPPFLGCRLPYESDGLNLLNQSDIRRMDARAVFSEELSEKMLGPPKVAMMENGFKAVYSVVKRTVTELYNLRKDKTEQYNMIQTDRAKSLEFEERIESWKTARQEHRAKLGLRESSISLTDEKKTERLKSLGYIKGK